MTKDQLERVAEILKLGPEQGYGFGQGYDEFQDYLLSPEGFVAIMDWLRGEGIKQFSFWIIGLKGRWVLNAVHKDSTQEKRIISTGEGDTPQEALLNAMIQYLEAKDG